MFDRLLSTLDVLDEASEGRREASRDDRPRKGPRGFLGRLFGGISDLAEGEFPEGREESRGRPGDRRDDDRERRGRDREGFDFD